MSPADLVGTWRLLSFTKLEGTGTTYPMGERVDGRITYEPSGRMAVQMTRSDRAPLNSADPSYLGYFGRYTMREQAVVHHVEGASLPDWVGTDQVRYVELVGNRLTLRAPPQRLADGREAVLVAAWEKMAATAA